MPKTLDPYYIIGKPAISSNAWIAQAKLILNDEDNTILYIVDVTSQDELYFSCQLNQGTYGVVLLYKSAHRQCAVKKAAFNCSYDDPADQYYISPYQLSHPKFNVKRTTAIPMVFTAFFGTNYNYQLMELGTCAQQSIPMIKLHFSIFYTDILIMVLNIIKQRLCYTDFKINNIIYYSDSHFRRFRLGDVETLGCNSLRATQDAHFMRVAAFPVFGNQEQLNYPLPYLLQTWYSAVLLLFCTKTIVLDRPNKYIRSMTHTMYKKRFQIRKTINTVLTDTHPFVRFLSTQQEQDALNLPQLTEHCRRIIDTLATYPYSLTDITPEITTRVSRMIEHHLEQILYT